MANILETVGELSEMRKTLNVQTQQELRAYPGSYIERLRKVNAALPYHQNGLMGTNITRPSVLTRDKKGRIHDEITPLGFNMNVNNLQTSHGWLSLFPMHIIQLDAYQTPIFDPERHHKSFSVVHLPDDIAKWNDRYNPVNMKVDLAFTVDEDSMLYVNGTTSVTADEFRLFDEIVAEFESHLSDNK